MLYVDGKWVEEGQPAVSPEDRGYNFGDGIYEVIRVYKGKLFTWDAHISRLYRSAREIRLDLPWTEAQLREIVEQLMAKNPEEAKGDAIVYLQISRGATPRVHDIPAQSRPVLMAFVRKMERPLEKRNQGLRGQLVEDIRWLRCDLKTLNLLGAVLVKEYAKDAGAQDAIMHRNGFVTECSSSNVFAVKDGTLYTHQADNLILHGITRQVVIDLARKNGLTVVEEAFTPDFLLQADEVFLTSTTQEVMPFVSVNGQPIGDGKPGPVTQKLQALFDQHIEEEVLV